MVLLGKSLSFIPWTWLKACPGTPYLRPAMLLTAAFLLAYPFWIIYRRVARPAAFLPGVRTLAKEFALAIPLTFGALLTVGMLIQLLNLAFGRSAAMPKVWHDVAMWADPTAAIILMV